MGMGFIVVIFNVLEHCLLFLPKVLCLRYFKSSLRKTYLSNNKKDFVCCGWIWKGGVVPRNYADKIRLGMVLIFM
jgi:hypothetical protein